MNITEYKDAETLIGKILDNGDSRYAVLELDEDGIERFLKDAKPPLFVPSFNNPKAFTSIQGITVELKQLGI